MQEIGIKQQIKTLKSQLDPSQEQFPLRISLLTLFLKTKYNPQKEVVYPILDLLKQKTSLQPISAWIEFLSAVNLLYDAKIKELQQTFYANVPTSPTIPPWLAYAQYKCDNLRYLLQYTSSIPESLVIQEYKKVVFASPNNGLFYYLIGTISTGFSSIYYYTRALGVKVAYQSAKLRIPRSSILWNLINKIDVDKIKLTRFGDDLERECIVVAIIGLVNSDSAVLAKLIKLYVTECLVQESMEGLWSLLVAVKYFTPTLAEHLKGHHIWTSICGIANGIARDWVGEFVSSPLFRPSHFTVLTREWEYCGCAVWKSVLGSEFVSPYTCFEQKSVEGIVADVVKGNTSHDWNDRVLQAVALLARDAVSKIFYSGFKEFTGGMFNFVDMEQLEYRNLDHHVQDENIQPLQPKDDSLDLSTLPQQLQDLVLRKQELDSQLFPQTEPKHVEMPSLYVLDTNTLIHSLASVKNSDKDIAIPLVVVTELAGLGGGGLSAASDALEFIKSSSLKVYSSRGTRVYELGVSEQVVGSIDDAVVECCMSLHGVLVTRDKNLRIKGFAAGLIVVEKLV